jgi:predicted metal-dependent hydrolase
MPESISLSIDEKTHDVAVKRHSLARRLTLRVDPVKQIRLTVPKRCSERRMREFLDSHVDWLRRQIVSTPASLAFAPGAVFPLRGEPHTITHEPKLRGTAYIESAKIFIGGDLRHLPRRLRDFLKKQAKRDFEEVVARHAQSLNVHVRRIQLRDPRSRWGSCSRMGVISFSWRLIMAPPFVLDYLCAHEVAHLRHMDHGKKFWVLVEEICPHRHEARTWLKANGNALLAIGEK